MTEKRRLVFDVESVGLHGEAFAVGYVLLLGEWIVDEGWVYCLPSKARGTAEGRTWVAENCPWGETGMDPAVLSEHGLPAGRYVPTPAELRDWFWKRWQDQRVQGAELWADVSWPVEARFLIESVEDRRRPGIQSKREWEGPYPLLDVRSYTEAIMAHAESVAELGESTIDEAATVLVHHPLADARVSAQKLLRVERILRKCLPS